MTTAHSKIINEIWMRLGMPAWIKFIPTFLEMRDEVSINICVAKAYREGFKAGAATMQELATKAAERVIAGEQAERN